MSYKLKILVVDDTVFYRQLLSKLIEEIPDVDFMGVASNGKIALKKIELSQPDLVIMDMAMPEMDGLQALEHIKVKYSGINVIMLSGDDKEAATLTVKALEIGALDFIYKPNAASPDIAFAELKSALLPLISLSKAIKASKESRKNYSALIKHHAVKLQDEPAKERATTNLYISTKSENRATDKAVKHRDKSHDEIGINTKELIVSNYNKITPHIAKTKRELREIEVVVIGVSTGGPNTLKNIIPKLPKDFSVPILTVQHMPPLFTASLAESLNKASAIKVVEAKVDQSLESGIMYIAPGGRHMVVRKGAKIKIDLIDSPPINNCRPSVDVLFRSVAMVYGSKVLAVILTGMGHDGLSGVSAIRRKGGYSLVQDEKSSVVWGMPGAIVAAGEADEVHAEDRIANKIVELVEKSRQGNFTKLSKKGGYPC